MRRSSRFPALLPALLALLCSAAANRIVNAQNADFDSISKSATAAREAGKAREAMDLYKRAVQLRPDWAEGWWYLGTTAYDADKFPEAIEAFQRVVELSPNLGRAWNFLGLCEYEQKDYENALTHLDKGKSSGDSDDPDLARVAHFHLALLRIRRGAFAEASSLIAQEFGSGAIPEQAQFALGLTTLRISLLPEEVDPSKDGLVQEAGRLAAEEVRSGRPNPGSVFPPLLQKFPDAPYLHFAFGEALAASGQTEEALGAFRKEAQISPGSEAAKLAVQGASSEDVAARAKAEVGTYYRAGASVGTAPSSASGDAWNLAVRDVATHKYADAIRDLKAVVEQKPNFGTAWAMLGLCEFEVKEYSNARLHLQKGQELGFGGSAESVRDARYHLALLLIRDGEFERATALLISQAEGSSLAREIQAALGMALLRTARLPEEVTAPNRSLIEQAGEISILLHNSRYDLALPKLKQLLAEHPDAPFLHYAYGTALSSLSQFAEAQPQLLAETKVSPKSELPYLSLASIALKLKHPEEALPYAQKAVALAPEGAEPHYFLGRSYLALDKVDEAVRELEAAAKMAPSSAEVHFQLARAYTRAKQPERAARERETFARLNAQLEKQRSREGNQAYGASHSGDLADGGMQPPANGPQ